MQHALLSADTLMKPLPCARLCTVVTTPLPPCQSSLIIISITVIIAIIFSSIIIISVLPICLQSKPYQFN